MTSLKITGHPVFGKQVVAEKRFVNGEVICQFGGSQVNGQGIPELVKPEDDRYLQIGEDLYLGPSGTFDDYFNHSCDPNAGLSERENGFFLIALTDINPGEEITWDYSTDMAEDRWELDCQCGKTTCRGRIRDFKYLPVEIRKKYLELGIVPRFVARSV